MVVIETFLFAPKPADILWLTSRATKILTADELKRWRQFRVEQARGVFLASRFLLRCILAERAGCAASEIKIARGDHGKPFLESPAGAWQFSLSHSHNCVLLAVAQGIELGVDVEQHKARVTLADLAERVLTAEEQRLFFALDESLQRAFFFDTWVLKESYIKLLGTGIWHGLNTLATDASTPRYPDDAAAQAVYLDAPEGFSAALAYRAQQPVHVHQRRVQRLVP